MRSLSLRMSNSSMPKGSSRARTAGLVLAALAACAALAAADEAYETPGTLPADRFLSAAEMRGEQWSVEPRALNDGMMNTYTIDSQYGSWQARGDASVPMRIREVLALARLDEISKSRVFLDAVKNSVTAPLKLAAAVVDKPVETLKGIPSGVGRWFRKTTFMVRETYHDARKLSSDVKSEPGPTAKESKVAEEGKRLAKRQGLKYLGISGAERRWYADLGVDPFTDNQVLRDAIASVARVDGLTGFGLKFVIPGVPFAGDVKRTMNLVWNTDPWELRLRNERALLDAGISEKTARHFDEQHNMTLTMKTMFLGSLSDLEGVEGRENLLARALDCSSREEGERLVATTAMLVRVHQHEKPLVHILPGTWTPVARTADGALVAVVLADSIHWTAPVAKAIRAFVRDFAGQASSARLMFVSGESSDQFRSAVADLGWTVVDHCESRWPEPEVPEAEAPATR